MVQIFLVLESLIDVRAIVEKGGWTQDSMALVVIRKAHVELFHEEFVTESNEGRWNVVEHNVIKKSALIDLVQDLLVCIVSNCHVWVIASCNMESQEVLKREEWLVKELRHVTIVRFKTFCLHLWTTDTNEAISIVSLLIEITHETSSFQIVSGAACCDEKYLTAASAESSTAHVSQTEVEHFSMETVEYGENEKVRSEICR